MALVSELKRQAVGGTILSAAYYKKLRALYLHIKRGSTKSVLGFLYHPAGCGVYLVPASKLRLTTREQPRPVFDLEGVLIRDVVQPLFDRFFTLELEFDKGNRKLSFEALGPNGNVWLLNSAEEKLASLRRKEFAKGDKYTVTPLPHGVSPLGLTADDLLKALTVDSERSLLAALERQVHGLNRRLAEELIDKSGLHNITVAELDHSAATTLVDHLVVLIGHFEKAEHGYLYSLQRSVEAYPLKMSLLTMQPERFKSISLAVKAATEIRQTNIEQIDNEKTIRASVGRAINKLERRIRKLRTDIDQSANFDLYHHTGDLLQIHFAELRKGMSSITVDDVMADHHEKIEIDLDPAATPSQNVEHYFKKARKGRKGLELLKRRMSITQDELAHLESIYNALEENFDNALKQYEPEITALQPGEATARETVPRLPYRQHSLSTGLKIYVGRQGSDNDRTTFDFARPYEYWFHAQQCPGSHVVMKFPTKTFEPSMIEIEEAAAVAAWYSKARKDSLVPVIYTRRKYVRKPRKAKPGLVTVEREKSLMVAPKKATD